MQLNQIQQIKQLPYIAAGLAILICLATWALDLTGLVAECPYCRTERTVIGILGLITLLPLIPIIPGLLVRYLGYVLGFFGAHVAAAQIFLTVGKYRISMFVVLATCALFIVIAQVMYIHYLAMKKQSALQQL